MKYFIRSVKYLVAVCIFALLFMGIVVLITPGLDTPKERLLDTYNTTLHSYFPYAMIALAAFYPLFGFTRKRQAGSLVTDREQIINAFEAEGFKPVQQTETEMLFRAGSPLKKLMMLYEDEIRVTQEGDFFRIEGNRRAVARIHYRLQTYLNRYE